MFVTMIKHFFVGKSMKSEHESTFFPNRTFIVYTLKNIVDQI